MKIERFATAVGVDPFTCCKWDFREIKIVNYKTKEVVFHLEKAEIPVQWSDNAATICASKYFRMVGVPNKTSPVPEEGVPEWLFARIPTSDASFGGETSVKQVVHRMSGFWTYWGWKLGYFDGEEDARAYYDECVHMLLMQWAAPNTPQFFNSGINWAYGITGTKKGMWRCDPETGLPYETADFFTNPGVHACHILSVDDSLLGENSIYDNITIEARAFSIGGGAGANFSHLRANGELLSTGNGATGVMSFLKVFDRSAGTIKSGSSSRRAAKMVVLDIDHPEIEEFIDWKAEEEKKVHALGAAGYDCDLDGEAYRTVSGQNSNNSVRLTDKFITACEQGEDWQLTARTDSRVIKTVKARDLWNKIVKSAHTSGDPGIQFHDIYNEWNTCAGDGEIRATNPCSELAFLDNSSCNLASINLQKIIDPDLDVDFARFKHICDLLAVTLDISNGAAQFPSRGLALGTYNYRLIGIGHTGIGAVLMRAGIPYDSDEARVLMSVITSLMTANVYAASAKVATAMGAFPRFTANEQHMRRVVRQHAELSVAGDFKMKRNYAKITNVRGDLNKELERAWADALNAPNGWRNAFVTLIAPSGTISFIMDGDTQSLEPDFSIVKFKKLIGGGSMKLINEGVKSALFNLGYTESEVTEMMKWVLGNGTLKGAPHISWDELEKMGVTKEDLSAIEKALPAASQLRFAFDLSSQSRHNVGIEPKFSGNLFRRMNFTKEQYVEANNWICGHGTLEGAPHLKQEHLPIFDCAVKSGVGQRFIPWRAHIDALAAVSPYLSGSVSKTINMPNEATEADVANAYAMAFKAGIKCLSIYRDGSKRTQPLNNPSDMGWWEPRLQQLAYLRGERKKPPKRRKGLLEEATINDAGKEYKLWVQFFEYEDGSLCEIWIDISKENPYYKQALKWWARAVSNAIQYGQPLDELRTSFLLEEGGPSGKTNHKYITYCRSIPDFVMKLISMHYLGDTNWCRIKPPIDELRCHFDHSREYIAPKTPAVKKEAATISVQQIGISDCDRCGGPIQQWPCPVCTVCGKSFGGCTA